MIARPSTHQSDGDESATVPFGIVAGIVLWRGKPVGPYIMRLLGKDLLARKMNRGQSSTYWKTVEPPEAGSIERPY